MERPGVVFSIFLVALIGTIQTTMAFDDGLAEISFSVLVFVSSFIIGIYVLHIHVLCRNSMFFYIDRTLIEITLSSLSRVRSCAKPFARPGETPGNSSGNLGKTSPYSPYIAPGCSLGSSH